MWFCKPPGRLRTIQNLLELLLRVWIFFLCIGNVRGPVYAQAEIWGAPPIPEEYEYGWSLLVYPAFYQALWKGAGIRVSSNLLFRDRPLFMVEAGVRYFSGVRPEENRPGTFDRPEPSNIRLETAGIFWITRPFRSVYVVLQGGVSLTPQMVPYAGIGIGTMFPIISRFRGDVRLTVQTRSIEDIPVPAFPRIVLALGYVHI